MTLIWQSEVIGGRQYPGVRHTYSAVCGPLTARIDGRIHQEKSWTVEDKYGVVMQGVALSIQEAKIAAAFALGQQTGRREALGWIEKGYVTVAACDR
jgi:hypothetical protein